MCVEDMSESGSITIFFSLILLCLITFTAGVFDMTRIKVIHFEAMSNASVASEYALSQYNPILMNEYGLFAGKKGNGINQIVFDNLNAIYYPNKYSNHEYFVDSILAEESTAPIFEYMTPKTVRSHVEYLDFLDSDFAIPKQQIIEYMSYRKDYLAVNLFAEKLDFTSKASKSSQVIEEKDELIQSLDSVNKIKLKVMSAIDGIYLLEDNTGYFDNSKPYVRQFSYDGDIEYSNFPESFHGELMESHISYNGIKSQVISAVNEIDSRIYQVIHSDIFAHLIQEAIDNEEEIDMDKIIFNWTPDGNEELTNSIGYLKNEAKESLVLANESINKLLTLKQTVEEALESVDVFIEECKSNVTDIKVFQSQLSEQDECITGLIEQVNEDLDHVLTEIDVSEDSLASVDNIQLIREQLQSNLEILTNSCTYFETIQNNLDNYIYRSYLVHIEGTTFNEEKMYILENRIFNNLKVSGKTDYTKAYIINNLFEMLDKHMIDLDADIYLNYDGIEKNTAELVDYDAKKKNLLSTDVIGFLESNNLIQNETKDNLIKMKLPSSLLGINIPNQDSNSFEEGKAFTDQMALLGAQSYGMFDSVLINEYIIGMFGNVAKSNDINASTLNHYKLQDREMKYEVEYILGGSIHETDNLRKVLGYLFGIRFVSNSIHLAVDALKRASIMKIAMLIAGWWTGGVGAVILGLVIGATWALIESMADIFLLITGSSVPLVKTRSTWYTSIDGNIEGLFDGGIRAIENKGNMIIDELKEEVKKVGGELQELIHSVQSEGVGNIDEFLMEVFDELQMNAVMDIDQYNSRLDEQMNRYVEEVILAYESKSVVDNPYPLDSEEGMILEDVRLKTVQYLGEMPEGDRESKVKLIELKETICKEFESRIMFVKEEHKEQCIDMFSVAMESEKLLLETQIDSYAKQGKKIGKEVLHSYADNVKKNFKTQLDDMNKGAVKGVNIVPCFSYEDYLRLFLLLPIVSDTVKVARSMDLIQLNLSSKKTSDTNEYESLFDYFAGVSIGVELEVDTMFLPDELLMKSHRIHVRSEMVYYDEINE